MRSTLRRQIVRLTKKKPIIHTYDRAFSWHGSRIRFFSTESPDTQTEKAEDKLEVDEGSVSKTSESKKVIFPWRHEESPLPRLVEGTIEYETKGQLLTTTKMEPGDKTLNAFASAFMFLDVPIYQFLFFSSWKAELADNASWAFTRGVAGLLSNLSSNPIDSIVYNTYEIDFKGKVEPTEDPSPDPSVPLEDMFDEKLLSLFRDSQKSLDSDTEVHLKVMPFQTELYSLYAVPYISRDKVRRDSALLKFYRAMMEKPSMDRAPDLNKLRKEHLETGRMESTVIAQVLVWCEETFFVKDMSSGEVLQGVELEGTRKIPHLVRMETTVRTTRDDVGTFKNIAGNWIITDIDDLVDGNLIV